MKTKPSLKEFFQKVYSIWVEERPGQLAAALAYYGMFAFAPVIFFMLWIAGLFLNNISPADQFYTRLESFFGPEVTTLIQDAVDALGQTTDETTLLATLVSIGALLMAASGLFYQLLFALNKIWDLPEPERGQTWGMVRQRLFSFLMVIGVGLLFVLGTLVSVIITWFGSLFDLDPSMPVLNFVGFLGLATLAFALIFKILPETHIRWRDVWIGAFVTSILVTLAVLLFGAYLNLGNIGSAFEAAGAFAVLLIGIYTIAQVFLFGAMFTRVYSEVYGSRSIKEQSEQEES
jgi:membrane protein